MAIQKYLLLLSLILFTASCSLFRKTTAPETTETRTNVDTVKTVKNDTGKIENEFAKKQRDDSIRRVQEKQKVSLEANKPIKIAVLAPLFLDSAFKGYSYRLGNTNIPRFFMPGLEFYNGIMLAVDTLSKQNEPVEVWIIDTRKKGESIQSLAADMERRKYGMVIASVTSTTEQKVLADYALNNSIPFISATYPNDANITGNPFFILLNSTWKTHAQAAYKYMAQQYRGSNMVLVSRPGYLEEKLIEYYNELNKAQGNPLRFTTIILNDNFSADEVITRLDKTKQNVVICGTLHEKFSQNLIKILNNSEGFSITAIGTPTWHGMRGTTGNESENIQIIMTTPFNYISGNRIKTQILEDYKSKYFAEPGEMVYKGYESMYRFSKLLTQNRENFINNISDDSFKVINDFKFEPVKNSSQFIPDFLENKKIYIIKVVNGSIQYVQ